MKCPVDDIDLVMTERSGVEIDYCPRCRGVWLDRGELDKIIDRSARLMQEAPHGADHPTPAAGPPAPSHSYPSANPPAPPPRLLNDPSGDGRYGNRGERFGRPPEDRSRGDRQRYDQPRYEQPGYDRPRYDHPRQEDDRYHRDELGYDRKYGKYADPGRHRTKDNWLGELFDF